MQSLSDQSYVAATAGELDARVASTALRNILRLNSEFSLITGLIGLVLGGAVADLIGIDQAWLVRLLGLGLMAFSIEVFLVASARTAVLTNWSRQISGGDLGWVAGTIAVIAAGWLSTRGAIIMGGLGIVVLMLALGQLRARGRVMSALEPLDDGLDESPPIEIVHFSRPADASPEALWPVMIDHELYARLALNLRAAEGLTPNGAGFKRSCTDALGRSWSETCTLWEEGHRFDVDVDTSDYPYPLRMMEGSWMVEAGSSRGSVISMTFAFQPTRGLKGRLFAPLMHIAFPLVLKRVARGWQRGAT